MTLHLNCNRKIKKYFHKLVLIPKLCYSINIILQNYTIIFVKGMVKMRKTRIITSIIVVAIMLTAMIATVSAAGSYTATADKWYVMSNGTGVGCEGWTNLVYDSDGSYVYHYTNCRAWSGSSYWDSGRKWGYGQVQNSTGNTGHTITAISIYYGIS
jgi:hypothetical protein